MDCIKNKGLRDILLTWLGWILLPCFMLPLRWKKLGNFQRTLAAMWTVVALLVVVWALQGLAAPKPTGETAVPVSGGLVPDDVPYDVVLYFPVDQYPETASHIAAAIENGETAICTIDRSNAEENREKSLQGIPTKPGYDRDEWPMAMCAEGGEGTSVAYVESSDNRGAGAWVGNQLEGYEDGTRVLFVLEAGKAGVVPVTDADGEQKEVPAPDSGVREPVYYANCAEVRKAGAAPLYKGDPGYSPRLDRDGDGIACE